MVTATGLVTIEHANAVVVQANLPPSSGVGQTNVGDPVYKGDVVQTGANGKVGITFTDGTTFNLSSNAMISLRLSDVIVSGNTIMPPFGPCACAEIMRLISLRSRTSPGVNVTPIDAATGDAARSHPGQARLSGLWIAKTREMSGAVSLAP